MITVKATKIKEPAIKSRFLVMRVWYQAGPEGKARQNMAQLAAARFRRSAIARQASVSGGISITI
jgi:hypothetical protein